MPNQNSTTDDQNPIVSFPLVDEVLPPMPQASEQSTVNSEQLDTTPATVAIDSGSAAPSDDVIMPQVIGTTPSKKKFAGGKVIATILGLFLLVGGVGAGVFLTGQNQNPNEKAANGCGSYTDRKSCVGQCSPIKADGKSWECKWHEGSQNCGEGNTECGTQGGDPAPIERSCDGCTIPPNSNPGQYSCDGINYVKCDCKTTCILGTEVAKNGGCQYYCGITYGGINCTDTDDPNDAFTQKCDSTGNSGYTKSCKADGTWFDGTGECYHKTNGVEDGLCALYPGCLGTGDPPGGTCVSSCNSNGCSITSGYGGSCFAMKYTCNGNSGTCPSANNPAINTEGPSQSFTFSNNLCNKLQQIDVPTNFVTKIFPPCETEPPTGPTAQCSNVKAYSTSWSLLSDAQLSALKSGNQVYFCVNGVSSAGSFDKAKFTIQSVLRPEVTAKRPNSNDYCDLYTIPNFTVTTVFNVSAQIHHITLGWK